MRTSHAFTIGACLVLACFLSSKARADCLGAIPQGVSGAFARGQLDEQAQKTIDEEAIWGRNPLEEAAEGRFKDQSGVIEYAVGEQLYHQILFSVLNREAITRTDNIKVNFGNGVVEEQPTKPSVTIDPVKPSVTADLPKPLATTDSVKPFRTADPDKPRVGVRRFALSAKTQLAPPPTFWVPPHTRVVLPAIPKEEPMYTIAIRARPSC
jgi:hypothetical protein